MKDLRTRSLTGLVYVALTIGAGLAGPLTTFLLFLPVAMISATELRKLMLGDAGKGYTESALMAGAAYAAIGLGSLSTFLSPAIGAAILLFLFLVRSVVVLRSPGPDTALRIGASTLELVLVALPFALLPHLSAMGHPYFLGAMVQLWTADTGGYVVGNLVGRTKLMPAVSPGKSVEGLIGGIVLTLGTALLLARVWPVLDGWQWAVAGFAIAISGAIGDLLESGLKRARGVKDSGTILPGHGGMLDRFDGLLLAVPAFYLYLLILQA